ncbi:hypothetical protein BLA29_014398 [Euroglyphus maynei]|uniref:Uncharacterized protein n=1 Tax=Euroglyphus maynei TaxID=6958 RepID=A0A1Y3AU09_EURMA|nr:hypothetical protein BLA29_014398 [Euroglyphus maynei]
MVSSTLTLFMYSLYSEMENKWWTVVKKDVVNGYNNNVYQLECWLLCLGAIPEAAAISEYGIYQKEREKKLAYAK